MSREVLATLDRVGRFAQCASARKPLTCVAVILHRREFSRREIVLVSLLAKIHDDHRGASGRPGRKQFVIPGKQTTLSFLVGNHCIAEFFEGFGLRCATSLHKSGTMSSSREDCQTDE